MMFKHVRKITPAIIFFPLVTFVSALQTKSFKRTASQVGIMDNLVESEPVGDNLTVENQTQNRRVEFVKM